MSRDLTTDFKNAATAQVVTPILLVKAEFDTETLRFWNGIGPFVYDSETYTGSGNLLTISEVVETQSTEARGVTFDLNGLTSELVAIAMAEDYQERRITLSFAFLDSAGDVIADPFVFFSGKANVMDIDQGGSGGVIRLSVDSDLVILGRINERRRTPEDQKLNFPGDTFFDQVAALQSKDIVWGGK